MTSKNGMKVMEYHERISPQFQIGMYMVWDLAVGAIPAGWQAADGTNGTRDLRNRFVVGAGSTYTDGDVGGTTTHTHTVSGTTAQSGGATPVVSAAGVNVSPSNHTHAYSTTSASAGTLPPYMALTWIAYTGL